MAGYQAIDPAALYKALNEQRIVCNLTLILVARSGREHATENPGDAWNDIKARYDVLDREKRIQVENLTAIFPSL